MLSMPLIFAVTTAGAIGGVHCVGMCGGISSLFTRLGRQSQAPRPGGRVIPIAVAARGQGMAVLSRYQFMLHGGRIFSYMIAGAVFGAFGAAGMLFKPYLPVQQILFFIGNMMLLLLASRILGWLPSLPGLQMLWVRWYDIWSAKFPLLQHAGRRPFLLGMGWGCLPCGLLYGVAPFALLSGDAWSGAVLMLMFGLSALPHLLISQVVLQKVRHTGGMQFVRYAGGAVLLGLGIFGLWFADMKNMPDFLCVVARS